MNYYPTNTTERYFIAWTASNSFSFFPDCSRPSLWLQKLLKLCVLILTCKIKKFFVHKNKLVENLSNPNHNTSSSYLTTLSLCLVDLKASLTWLVLFCYSGPTEGCCYRTAWGSEFCSVQFLRHSSSCCFACFQWWILFDQFPNRYKLIFIPTVIYKG